MGSSKEYLKVLKAVEKIVKDKCITEDRWKYHIYPVVEYGKILAKKLKADAEVVELACWLHDLTRLTGDVENHHKTSALESAKILKNLNYDEKKINKITACIYAHRGSVKVKKNSIEEKIVACADAMSHFEFRIILFYSAFGNKKMSLEDGIKWISSKIDRSWNKIDLPIARDIVVNKYKAMKDILDFTNKKNFSKLINDIRKK